MSLWFKPLMLGISGNNSTFEGNLYGCPGCCSGGAAVAHSVFQRGTNMYARDDEHTPRDEQACACRQARGDVRG